MKAKRIALLDLHGFFRFFEREDPSILEFVESECTVLERWGLDLEQVVAELGSLLTEWSALLKFRNQIFPGSYTTGLATFSERISGITFFGKDDPDFLRTELREVLYYVIYGRRAFNNVCLFDHWTDSLTQISRELNDEEGKLAIFNLRSQENKFHPIDGYRKFPRIGVAFWQQAIGIFTLRFGHASVPAVSQERKAAATKQPRGDIYSYMTGVDVDAFRKELFQRGIISGAQEFIPRKNTFHKLTHILALPYMLQHLGVMDASFFECTQLERVDIYAASFSIRFGRNVLSDLAVTDFITQLDKKDQSDIAWVFYKEIAAAVEASIVNR
jgi:hypothetical protein